MDGQIDSAGGGVVGGSVGAGGDFIGRDRIEIKKGADNFGWWLDDIRDKLIRLQMEQNQRFSAMENEFRELRRDIFSRLSWIWLALGGLLVLVLLVMWFR